MSSREPSCRYLLQFLETSLDEMGQVSLANVLAKAGMPVEWANPERVRSLRGADTARVFAGLQHATRTYYGRGARGALMRTGRALWERLVQQASLPLKIRTSMVQVRPASARLEPALGVLIGLLGVQRGEVTVHRVDQYLVLEDRASPTTLGQSEGAPICYVTLGMAQACLLWATGGEYDIEETRCRANGSEACEFRILTEVERI